MQSLKRERKLLGPQYKPFSVLPSKRDLFQKKNHFQAIFYKSISFSDDQNRIILCILAKIRFKIYGSSILIFAISLFFQLLDSSRSDGSIIHLLPWVQTLLNSKSTREAVSLSFRRALRIFGILQISIARWNSNP